jgi:hypothetical protein
MLGDDLVEDGATGVSRLVSGGYHRLTFGPQLLLGSPKLPYYTFVHYIRSLST